MEGGIKSAICWSLTLPDTAASINHKPSQAHGIGKLSPIFAYWILQRVNEDTNRVKQRRELHRYVGVRRRWPNVYTFPREILSTRFIFGRCRRVSVAERWTVYWRWSFSHPHVLVGEINNLPRTIVDISPNCRFSSNSRHLPVAPSTNTGTDCRNGGKSVSIWPQVWKPKTTPCRLGRSIWPQNRALYDFSILFYHPAYCYWSKKFCWCSPRPGKPLFCSSRTRVVVVTVPKPVDIYLWVTAHIPCCVLPHLDALTNAFSPATSVCCGEWKMQFLPFFRSKSNEKSGERKDRVKQTRVHWFPSSITAANKASQVPFLNPKFYSTQDKCWGCYTTWKVDPVLRQPARPPVSRRFPVGFT